MAECQLHGMAGRFIEGSFRELDERGAYHVAGWWAFQGFELERVCLRTREDDNDLRVMIAREGGRVVAVLTCVRPGAREWGWV